MKQPSLQIPDGCREVLLHACCAPCSSAIVEWLLQHDVRPTIFYYNPNIWPREEYNIRKDESKRHAASLGIRWIDADYDHQSWLDHVHRAASSGAQGCPSYDVASEPERGRRCEQCFTLRLTATARKAQQLGIPFFATTLASSRWKSLDQINRAGLLAEEAVQHAVRFWPQNWRKDGLQERRNQLLRQYDFYNQQYCGCEFSAGQGSAAVPLTKPLLRQQMRQAKQQHQDRLAQMSADIVSRFLTSLSLGEGRGEVLGEGRGEVFLCYWPLPDEVDIRPLIAALVAAGKRIVLPRVTGDDTMELRCYTSPADLREGAFHILEPTGALFTDYAAIDVALIPGMAFDAAGHRLGRGRGYYDRFLAQHPLRRTIGVCFPFQHVPQVPFTPHDIPVHEVV